MNQSIMALICPSSGIGNTPELRLHSRSPAITGATRAPEETPRLHYFQISERIESDKDDDKKKSSA